jgi:ComF family protein
MSAPLKDALRRIAYGALDIFWPRVCPLCGGKSDRENRHICSSCMAKIEWYESGGSCSVCETPIATEADHAFVCAACKTSRPAYEYSRSATIYAFPLDEAIRTFKYNNGTWLTNDLVDILEGALKSKLPYSEIDCVVPVPLHRTRFQSRGYNQSELLASELARRIDRRIDSTSFVRERNTPQQARLSLEERIKNVEGAFRVEKKDMIRGRTILLVDDVTTSMSTLNCCAKALKEAEAKAVWCLTLARRREG